METAIAQQQEAKDEHARLQSDLDCLKTLVAAGVQEQAPTSSQPMSCASTLMEQLKAVSGISKEDLGHAENFLTKLVSSIDGNAKKCTDASKLFDPLPIGPTHRMRGKMNRRSASADAPRAAASKRRVTEKSSPMPAPEAVPAAAPCQWGPMPAFQGPPRQNPY